MEHIIIEQLTEKIVCLTAVDGYELINKKNGETYMEAVVKDTQATERNWMAIEK